MSTSRDRAVVVAASIIVAAVTVALVALALLCGTQRVIGGDLWEHAAVVRAFARDPWSPAHPLLAISAPHAFFSPWLLAAGLLARAAHLDPFNALTVAGVVSVLALVSGQIVIVKCLATTTVQRAVGAVCLISFSLLLWAEGGWQWSGFVHLRALLYTSAYPSTFAFGLSLWIVAAAAALTVTPSEASSWWRPRDIVRATGIVVGTATVWVTHPTTAVSLSVFVLATVLGRLPTDRRAALVLMAQVGVCSALGLVLALWWPYFSLLSLLRDGNSAEFSTVSGVLYKSVLTRMWPALVVGIPLLIVRAVRLKLRDPAVLATLGCLVVYVVAGVLEKDGLGRIIAWVVFGLHLTAALEVGEACARWWRASFIAIAIAAVALLAAPMTLHAAAIAATAGRERPMWLIPSALRGVVGDDDVVLSDLGTSLSVPSHTGKIVASSHPLYWVPDHAARRADVARFFKQTTTKAQRLQIIDRWQVRWLFVDRARIKDIKVIEACAALGTVRSKGPRMIVDVGPQTRQR